MTWLTWRLFRAQAVTVYAAVAAAAVVLLVTRSGLPDADVAGATIYDQLTRADRNLYWAGIVLMTGAPALVGAFWGAPMVARELETGTHRLAWNQSVTRTRWLATKLGITTACAVLAIGGLSLAVSWWSSRLDGSMSDTRGSLPARLTTISFPMRGVVPLGYVVFALVLGVAFGLVLRRTVPAIVLTLAVFAFVQIAVPLWVRPHLLPAATQTSTISSSTLIGMGVGAHGTVTLQARTADPDDWVLSNQTVDRSGRAVASLPAWMADCLPPPVDAASVGKAPSIEPCLERLAAEGYHQRVVYQPASRFWPLQWVETGIFLAVSALLAWFCFFWTRRRLS